MTTEFKLAAAGFQVQLSPDQPARWGVTPEVYKRQTRFRKFIHETISCAPDAPGLLPARLVGLDGIKPSHLEYINSQASLPYGTEQGTVIDWLAQEPVRTERRLLSLLTLKAWPRPPMELAGLHISACANLAQSLLRLAAIPGKEYDLSPRKVCA
ncbi:MAG: hypothetical protein IPO43_19990 [Rhodoferax sp.]|nr:hypothetical protein [Rhodoferax sp.]